MVEHSFEVIWSCFPLVEIQVLLIIILYQGIMHGALRAGAKACQNIIWQAPIWTWTSTPWWTVAAFWWVQRSFCGPTLWRSSSQFQQDGVAWLSRSISWRARWWSETRKGPKSRIWRKELLGEETSKIQIPSQQNGNVEAYAVSHWRSKHKWYVVQVLISRWDTNVKIQTI